MGHSKTAAAAENTILPNEAGDFESGSGSSARIEKLRKRAEKVAKHHGLRAESPVIPGVERNADWKRHLQGFIDYYIPEGEVEGMLVERLANISWRFRRMVRFESAAILKHIYGMSGDMALDSKWSGVPVTEEDADREFNVRVFPPASEIDKIMRYETHLHRQYIQTSHHLEALQARRHGEPTPLARLDITGPPSSPNSVRQTLSLK